VSIALYLLTFIINTENWENWGVGTKAMIVVMLCVYACSVTFGRLYCGMHTITDCAGGVVMGTLLWSLIWYSQEVFDNFVVSDSWLVPLITGPICIILVSIHPDPVDKCPCFDDSVAFVGVMMGMLPGSWHYASTSYSLDKPQRGTIPYDYDSIGLSYTFARIILGVAILFIWRLSVKKLCYTVLPPIYRLIHAPYRPHYIPAKTYKTLHNAQLHVVPSVIHLPHLVAQDMVGSKSAIDVHAQIEQETLSCESDNSLDPEQETLSCESGNSKSLDSSRVYSRKYADLTPPKERQKRKLVEKERLELQKVEIEEEKTQGRRRFRYDVDIVTKLLVYAGIGWLAVDAVPILFDLIGLGVRSLS
jgi:membrane-associated phospholipid phosphatase